MMQMLHAGGMPISCAPGNEAISGEHESNTEALKLIACGLTEGKAIKCLDPLNFPLPPGKEYIFLWCKRDYVEQAKSMAKFLWAVAGIKVNKGDLKMIHKSLIADTPKSIKYLEGLGTVHVFEYEAMLAEPSYQAQRLYDRLHPWFNLDVNAMAPIVIDRSPKCYNGFMESVLIERAKI